MPNWKKVILSGSNASLNSLYVKTGVTGSSFTGSFKGNGSGLIGVVSSSYALTASYALNGGSGGGDIFYFNTTYRDQSGGTSDTYGALAGSINGANTKFTVSQGYYLTGTLKVWLNGQLQTQGNAEDWFEGTPSNGTFYFVSASRPQTNDNITVEYHRSVNESGSFLANLVEDTTPSLGGNLNGNGFSIFNVLVSGSFSGSFFGDGSGLTGVTAEVTLPSGIVSSSAQVDHGSIQGLLDNDHPQYVLNSVTSSMTVLSSSYAVSASWAPNTGGTSNPVVITTPVISADSHNYAPTGFATANVLRVSSSAFIGITGFDSTSAVDFAPKKLVNVGSFPIYLTGTHPSSSAQNRIISSRDVVILPNRYAEVSYDATDTKWRLTDIPRLPDSLQTFIMRGGSITAGDWGDLAFAVNGTGAANTTNAATTTDPSYYRHNAGTTTTGQAIVYYVKTNLNFGAFGSSHGFVEGEAEVEALSDGTDTFYYSLTLCNGPSTATTALGLRPNSVGIVYSHGVNSGNWSGVLVSNASAITYVDLGIPVVAGTRYLLRAEVNYSNTEARFYVNGNLITSANFGVRGPNAVVYGARSCLAKSAGTNQRYARIYYLSAGAYYI